MRKIELRLSKEDARAFIDWLANDDYWGHTITYWDVQHGAEEVAFIINGHELLNYSNQHHHVVIDNCYVCANNSGVRIHSGGEVYSPLDYCLKKLGFD